jgi:hypothetical protein
LHIEKKTGPVAGYQWLTSSFAVLPVGESLAECVGWKPASLLSRVFVEKKARQ